MKAIRKIFPAIAMLLISAVMMSTATFAWFSMNTTVAADGLTIQAKTASLFLQIVNSETAFSNTEDQVTATAKTSGDKDPHYLNPTHPVLGVADDKLSFTDLPETGDIDFKNISWVNAFSSKVDSSDKAANNKYETLSSLTGFVLVDTFKVRLNPAAGNFKGYDLTVSNVKITEASSDEGSTAKSLLPSCRLMLVCDNGVVVFDPTGKVVAGDANILDVMEVGADVSYTVSAYLYFDGEDKNCFTNNVVNLDKFNASFSLTVSGTDGE